MRYAQRTLVSVEKSKGEIEKTLSKYKADQFVSGWDRDKAYIAFRLNKWLIHYTIDLPSKTDKAFTLTASGRHRKNEKDIAHEWEQGCRQRWRALALVIKAKLEAVESGIKTFEDEFLSNVVLPDGSTVGKWFLPQLARAYENQKMPNLLLTMGEKNCAI